MTNDAQAGFYQRNIKTISVAKWYDPFVSILIVILAYFAFNLDSVSDVVLSILIIFSVLAIQFLMEFLRSKVEYKIEDKFFSLQLWKRILTKTIGIYTGVALILLFYWLIPEYNNPKYLLYLDEAKRLLLPILLPLILIYVAISEYLLGEKKDGTYHLGLFTTLQFQELDLNKVKAGILEWLVRLIFLTLNYTSVTNLLSVFRGTELDIMGNGFAGAVLTINGILFLLILFTILPGYLFSFRLINTTVKKIDSTWFAWTITLICYQPFITPIFGNIFDYSPNLNLFGGSPVWVYMTLGLPFLLVILGSLIILTEVIHLWAEATLGIRSSNLTNRGVITTGPFKYTKHPVYVSKCFGWFFITLPFFNMPDIISSIHLGILFLFILAIYAGRCLAEERLLATDKNYVLYAEYMDKHGLFAFVGRVLPFMTFSWRYTYWQKHNMLNNHE